MDTSEPKVANLLWKVPVLSLVLLIAVLGFLGAYLYHYTMED